MQNPLKLSLQPEIRGSPLAASQSLQSDGNCSALGDLAFHGDLAAIQVHAALDDHQTETGAWTIIDIVPANQWKKIGEADTTSWWKNLGGQSERHILRDSVYYTLSYPIG